MYDSGCAGRSPELPSVPERAKTVLLILCAFRFEDLLDDLPLTVIVSGAPTPAGIRSYPRFDRGSVRDAQPAPQQDHRPDSVDDHRRTAMSVCRDQLRARVTHRRAQ
jgi:hypothetical protein